MIMSSPGPRSNYWITPIEQCDVKNKDALQRFRQKRVEWLKWLFDDDDHAIGPQLWLMNWSYVTFRVINEARRIAARRDLRSPIRNHTLFRFATAGFVATQALAIRRLTEKAARKPERQVMSLRRLVDDIAEHQTLFTRELFVGFDGAPFDPEPGRLRWWTDEIEYLKAHGGVACRGEAYLTAGPQAWQHAERLHDVFDRLCGLGVESDRARSDRVPDAVFEKLKSLLEDPMIERVRNLVNKRIAHAADPVSRMAARHNVDGISFKDIDQVHRNLIIVAEFISSVLLSKTSIGTMPIPQFDAFEYLDAGEFDEVAIIKLRKLADVLAERRDRWARTSKEAVLASSPS